MWVWLQHIILLLQLFVPSGFSQQHSFLHIQFISVGSAVLELRV